MRYAAMIAHQRSGTHLIRETVNSHPNAWCAIEPFYRSAPQTEEELQAKIEHNTRDGPGILVCLFDIKYNQITPVVEEWLRSPDVPVMHLVRNDAEAHYFSWMLFRHMAKHPEDRGKNKTPRIKFDARHFSRWTQMIKRLRDKHQHFADLRISYEALTGGGHNVTELSLAMSYRLCAFLEVKPQILTTPMPKTAPEDYRAYWVGR